MKTIRVDTWRLGSKILKRMLGERRLFLKSTRHPSHYDQGSKILFWNLRNGFDVLLHEAAHIALNHKPSIDRKVRLMRELEAWIWAEEACHLWGLPFNYPLMDRYFSTYTSHVEGAEKWKINWRHK